MMRITVPPPAWLRALCFVAFLATLVQIFFLPRPAPAITDLIWDKFLHASGFGALAFCLWMTVGFHAPWLNWIAITVIGSLDEFHQIFVPTRTADVLDVVADAIGAGLVTLALQLVKKNEPTEGSRRALWTEQ